MGCHPGGVRKAGDIGPVPGEHLDLGALPQADEPLREHHGPGWSTGIERWRRFRLTATGGGG